jgi:hypothetical protein
LAVSRHVPFPWVVYGPRIDERCWLVPFWVVFPFGDLGASPDIRKRHSTRDANLSGVFLNDADAILRSLSALRPGGAFFLDVPAPNAGGLELAHRYGMSVVFETARMYSGGEWNPPLAQTFGITTYDLG